MALVEVIPALQTEDGSRPTMLWRKWLHGASRPLSPKDTPGFIVNRVARPFYSEALADFGRRHCFCGRHRCLHACAQGFRMGPFELMDLIGHDVNYAVTSTVHAAFYGDSRYRPSHTQRQLVAANWLGRKRDRGFYTYEAKCATRERKANAWKALRNASWRC